MKKIMFLLSVVITVTSCSISKDARAKRSVINGSWTLDNIAFENSTGNFKAVLFNDVEDICLEGSNWFFRNNNSTGQYTINPTSLCNSGDRFIRWSVVEREGASSQLQFKFIDVKNKDISGGLGYRLDIEALTEQRMTLKSNVNADGSPVTVVYEFIRK